MIKCDLWLETWEWEEREMSGRKRRLQIIVSGSTTLFFSRAKTEFAINLSNFQRFDFPLKCYFSANFSFLHAKALFQMIKHNVAFTYAVDTCVFYIAMHFWGLTIACWPTNHRTNSLKTQRNEENARVICMCKQGLLTKRHYQMCTFWVILNKNFCYFHAHIGRIMNNVLSTLNSYLNGVIVIDK